MNSTSQKASIYDAVAKDCEVRQKTKPAPPRARLSGVRATNFGDVVFMDHREIKHMTKKHRLYLVLDGATSPLWEQRKMRAQSYRFRTCSEWMHIHSCKPKWVVADVAFFTPSWITFWNTDGAKSMLSGRATPWPKRAEKALRLFNRQYEKLLHDAQISQNGAIVTVETDNAVLRVNQSKVRRDYDRGMMCLFLDPWTSPRRTFLSRLMSLMAIQKESSTDYVKNHVSFVTKVCNGNVSFDNSSQMLGVSTARCSMTLLLVDHGLEAKKSI